MKSFEETFSSRCLRASKWLLTKSVRSSLLRVPFLPASAAYALDDIRFVEPDVLRFVGNTIKRGWCCIDVGAHCGTVSARLAKLVSPSGLVVAVEPVPSNADLLERNLGARGLRERCVIVRSAVGARPGRIAMVRGAHSTTWHMACPGESDQEMQTVEVIPLDTIATSHRLPDFVKVDVEGAEVDLVAGARSVLLDARPIWLFEMHSPESWRLAANFFQSDYRAFDLQGVELSFPLPGSLSYGHIVFCPLEKAEYLG